MVTKEKMRNVIDAVKAEDESFLMNDCNGLDLLTDSVNKFLDSLKKPDLETLYKKAINSKRYKLDI